MQIECNKDILLESVLKTEKTTNKNASLPVLGCIVFVASNNTLTLKATNLEVGVEVSIPAKVIKEGVVAVPANLLSQTLNSIRNVKNINITEEGGSIVINANQNKTQIKTVSYTDFPIIPRLEEDYVEWSLKAKDFINGIKSVIWSASISSIKPELGSVFIYSKDNQLIFVATDSFRLAEHKFPLKTNTSIPNILIPFKNSGEIVRILEGVDGDFKIKANKNQINIITENIFITSRVVDGIFPDYEQIIPKEIFSTAVVLKQDMADNLKTLNVFSDKFNQISISVSKNGQMVMQTKNSDTGEGVGTIKAKVTGEDIIINFNHKYIQDALPAISDDSISFEFGGLHKPLLISNSNHKNFRYLVMPMNR